MAARCATFDEPLVVWSNAATQVPLDTAVARGAALGSRRQDESLTGSQVLCPRLSCVVLQLLTFQKRNCVYVRAIFYSFYKIICRLYRCNVDSHLAH